MRIIRPIPYENPHNEFIDLYLTSLRQKSFRIVTFKWWKIRSLTQRNIDFHLHWPEAVYRDTLFLFSLFKALRFIVFFYIHKLNGNKWYFFVHNIVPHEDTDYFKRKMHSIVFRILLKSSNRVIGLSENTIAEIHNTFEVSVDDKYSCIEHFLYPIDKIASVSESSNYLKRKINFKYILTFHSEKRQKGIKQLIQEFPLECDCKLIIVGSQFQSNNDNIIQIKDFPNTEIFNSLINNSMGVILNYDRITTSGMYFHCLSLNKMSIVPKLDFFIKTSSANMSIFYDMPLTRIKLESIIEDLNNTRFRIDRMFNTVDDFTSKI